MIRKCEIGEFDTIDAIINDAAQAYKGVIPVDCWKAPYMPKEELQDEIDAGVVFWGYYEAGELMNFWRGLGGQTLQSIQFGRASAAALGSYLNHQFKEAGECGVGNA